jgi:hypothetical protein
MVFIFVMLIYFISTFLYFSLVVAKESDEFEYAKEDKDA